MYILDFTKYLSNYDIIKYVLSISFVWIFLINFTKSIIQFKFYNKSMYYYRYFIYSIKYRFKKKIIQK